MVLQIYADVLISHYRTQKVDYSVKTSYTHTASVSVTVHPGTYQLKETVPSGSCDQQLELEFGLGGAHSCSRGRSEMARQDHLRGPGWDGCSVLPCPLSSHSQASLLTPRVAGPHGAGGLEHSFSQAGLRTGLPGTSSHLPCKACCVGGWGEISSI